MSAKPLSLPGRDQLNLAMLGGILAGGAALATTGDASVALPALGVGSAVAALLGAHATASIGAWLHPFKAPRMLKPEGHFLGA